MAEAVVSEADYAFVAKVLRERCALVLEAGKDYLIRSRLSPIAKLHGLESVGALIERVRSSGDAALANEIVEAMVTTETSFFRDVHPFEALHRSVLPELISLRESRRQLNIWCAASSSGQEPYSIALLLKERFPELADWRINLFATDISNDMLRRCRSGLYSQTEVNRGLPAAMLLKWFRQEGASWRLDDQVRNLVTFSQMNLAEPWRPMPLWDLVFLRNVMIYFDVPMKKLILGRVSKTLSQDGYLLLGGAETTHNLDESFRRVETLKSGFYRLKS